MFSNFSSREGVLGSKVVFKKFVWISVDNHVVKKLQVMLVPGDDMASNSKVCTAEKLIDL